MRFTCKESFLAPILHVSQEGNISVFLYREILYFAMYMSFKTHSSAFIKFAINSSWYM